MKNKIYNLFWLVMSIMIAMAVVTFSYIAIGLFWCLQFWPRWLPFPVKKVK